MYIRALKYCTVKLPFYQEVETKRKAVKCNCSHTQNIYLTRNSISCLNAVLNNSIYTEIHKALAHRFIHASSTTFVRAVSREEIN